MNRLQKKCLIVTVGFHLLLLVILVVGPGFFQPKETFDDLPILTAIPAVAVDQALSSGVRAAQPVAQPPPPVTQPVVTPPPPQRTETPPAPPPKPTPAPSVVDEIKDFFKSTPAKPEPKLTPDELKPVEKPVRHKEHKVDISLKEVHRTVRTNNSQTSDSEAQAREQQRLRKERLEAFRDATRAIQDNSSSATKIEMPGDSDASYANYGQIVKSIYDRAWVAPAAAADDDANTRVKVVINRDGTVVSAEIIERSGDADVDRSVQRALDKVQTIAPFPDGSTDTTRTYIINFNLKAKRMLG